MASMNTETALLRVLLRMSRLAAPATLDDLVAHVREDAHQVRRALRALAHAEFVQRTEDTARLTLSGLAVAVALASEARGTAKATRGEPKVQRDASCDTVTEPHGRVLAWPTPKRRRAAAVAA